MDPTWTSDCGTVRLWLADCRDVLKELPSGSVDAVVTDPPYGVGFKYESHNDTRDGYEQWCRDWFPHLRRVSSAVLMACGAVNVPMWATIEPFKWQVAWLKPAAMGRSPVGFCNWEPMLLWGNTKQSGAVDCFRACIVPDDSLEGHPCPKPLEWGLKSVECVSVPGQTICDPFMGSGTTIVAAVRLGRKFLGIEKEPKYFAIAKRRIQDALNSQPLFKEQIRQTQEELF
jgi:site-specific DNA-methyltransferase (adenine-specific)